ncbi:MAG: VWA domain-containing protein [Acholeplasmataceae bacterium]|nr:VWA domain-containing protein [Acholeplasmataceae bacterium]
MKKMMLVLVVLLLAAGLVSCSSEYDGDYVTENYGIPRTGETDPGDSYEDIVENDFVSATETPLSMFSVDANTASYSTIRNAINHDLSINPNQVRIEEMVNYFSYDLPEPEAGKPLSISTWVTPTPWNEDTYLLSIGLKAEEVILTDVRNNLVFLLDVSGSMDQPNKLGLMKEAFSLLIDSLHEDDTVSIVVYAGNDAILLEGAYGLEKTRIRNIINDLQAAGSTAGADGIRTAYNIASEYFIEGGNNRVILATDGDFNVGITNIDDLEDFIGERRETGIYLSVLGFGYGNYKDDRLENLSSAGNGNYAYIDSILEAKKVLVEEIGGTLNTVARDVKAQVEFNGEFVDTYRLLGYENKLLTIDEWNEESTDAGEIGSGHSIMVTYEIRMKEGFVETPDDHLFTVRIRYKSPTVGEDDVMELTKSHAATVSDELTNDIRFTSAVIEFALILRDSLYKGNAGLTAVLERLINMPSVYMDPYKEEFTNLVQMYTYTVRFVEDNDKKKDGR